MKIALASDHGGYELKNTIKEHLEKRGIEAIDLGVKNGETADYPLYGEMCALYVVSGAADLGVVCCGTGMGISIAANKVKGARCALVYSSETARLAKEHNDANLIALGGRTLKTDDALSYVDIWLDSNFLGGRHARRVGLLNSL